MGNAHHVLTDGPMERVGHALRQTKQGKFAVNNGTRCSTCSTTGSVSAGRGWASSVSTNRSTTRSRGSCAATC